MEEKISVTLKAGTGYDVPWFVLRAATFEELAEDLAKVQALFGDISYLAKAFEEAFKSAPATAGALVQSVLGGTQVSMEPNSPAPQYAPSPAAEPAPWDIPAPAVAPMPWESGAPIGPPVVAGVSLPLVMLPFVKKEVGPDGKPLAGSTYAKQMAFKDYFYQQRNKLNWKAERKGFEFTTQPTPELLNMARQGAAALGGSVTE